MKRFENSSSSSGPSDFSRAAWREEDKKHPIVLPLALSNAQTPVFNMGIGNPSDVPNVGNLNSVANAGVVGNAGELSSQIPVSNVEMNNRRPRGRPRGSKNRPKEEKDSAMKCFILDVPPEVDIIDWLKDYVNSKKVSIVVFGGKGPISQVTLSHLGSHLPPITYLEDLRLISLSGSYKFSPSTQGAPTFFNATVATKNGSIVGGTPHRLVTMGSVALTTAIYNNPEILEVSMQTRA